MRDSPARDHCTTHPRETTARPTRPPESRRPPPAEHPRRTPPENTPREHPRRTPTEAPGRSPHHPARLCHSDPMEMRTIGLLGGMSWESTAEYYRLLNELTRERLGGLHSSKC